MASALGTVVFVLSLLLLADARHKNAKSDIVEYADFKFTTILQVDICATKGCKLFAVAQNTGDYEGQIHILKDDAVMYNLRDIVRNNVGDDGLKTAVELPAGTYQVKNSNARENIFHEVSTFFFYFVSNDADNLNTAVYDAQKAKTISSPKEAFHSAVTVLSALPQFTLKNYDIGSAAGVTVYTTGFDSMTEDSVVLFSGSKERAALSFATIVGPIATVFMGKFDASATFKVTVDTSDLRTADFTPGAFFVAMSPGYAGNGMTPFASELPLQVTYKFKSSRESPISMHVITNIGQGEKNLTITGTGNSKSFDYSFHGKHDLDKKEMTASEISVDWERISGYFVARFESSGILALPTLLPIFLFSCLRFF